MKKAIFFSDDMYIWYCWISRNIFKVINTLRPIRGDAYIQVNQSLLVRIMACHLFIAMPLAKPKETYIANLWNFTQNTCNVFHHCVNQLAGVTQWFPMTCVCFLSTNSSHASMVSLAETIFPWLDITDNGHCLYQETNNKFPSSLYFCPDHQLLLVPVVSSVMRDI